MSAATSLPPASEDGDAHRSDAQLVALARRGDRAAADALISRHLETVQAVCRSRLSSPHDVNDAVQDTFVRALSKLDRLRDPDRVAPWLRAIAARVCVDQYRATRHMVVVPSPGAEHADLGRGPEDHAVGVDVARNLHVKLQTLSQRDRRALWLRDAEGLPVPDVARDLGLTEGSARVLLTRARHRLRASYQGLAGVALAGWIRLRDRAAALGSDTGFDVRAAAVAQAAVATAIVVAGLPAVIGASDPAPPGLRSVQQQVTDVDSGAATTPVAEVTVAPSPDPVTDAPAQDADATADAPPTTTVVDAGPATISRGAPPADAEPAAHVEAGSEDRPVGDAIVYVGDVLGGSSGNGEPDEPSGPEVPTPGQPSGQQGSGEDLFGGGLVRVGPR